MGISKAFAIVTVPMGLVFTIGCMDRSRGPRADSLETRPAVGESGQHVVGSAPAGSIIVLEPQIPQDFPVPSGSPMQVMDQSGRTFWPSMLVARQGQSVSFRNSDDELHNVRVTEGEDGLPVFNVATTSFGSYTHKFEQPGWYVVTCDIHSDMRADILVTRSPYIAVTDKNGNFELSNVRVGSYNLTAYTAIKRVERLIEITNSKSHLKVQIP